jgi:hypothetical protein
MRRTRMLTVLLVLAGCSASPADLGITGPAAPAPPEEPDDSLIGRPGIADPVNSYGPNVAPTTGGGRYYNYN